MKIQIDTDSKVIRLESDVLLEELFSKLRVLFPKGEWKKYKLETNVEIVWSNPIYIDKWRYPTYPWWTPSITYQGYNTDGDTWYGEIQQSDTTSVYCIEC